MSDEAPKRRLWISLGEGAAVLAVVISALSYWDAHREHSVMEHQVLSQAQARVAFVLTGVAENGGRLLALTPLKSTQAIQSQHYIFPSAVRADPADVSAAKPRIELDWIGSGLERAMNETHAAGSGAGSLPVEILTTYVEDGEMRTDRSIYRVGYSWQTRFLFGRRISLEGLSLIQRGIAGESRALLDRRWVAGQHNAPAGE